MYVCMYVCIKFLSQSIPLRHVCDYIQFNSIQFNSFSFIRKERLSHTYLRTHYLSACTFSPATKKEKKSETRFRILRLIDVCKLAPLDSFGGGSGTTWIKHRGRFAVLCCVLAFLFQLVTYGQLGR